MRMLMRTIRMERPRGFRVAGEVDMSNEGALSRVLAREAASEGDLTLDLSELVFIDSSGVRALLRTAGELAGRGRLLLVGVRPAIRRTFEIMGVDRVPGVVLEAASPRSGSSGRTRPDQAGDSHPVAEAVCACGCPYLYAADDLALFWEAGERYGAACTDRSCECHVAPLRG